MIFEWAAQTSGVFCRDCKWNLPCYSFCLCIFLYVSWEHKCGANLDVSVEKKKPHSGVVSGRVKARRAEHNRCTLCHWASLVVLDSVSDIWKTERESWTPRSSGCHIQPVVPSVWESVVNNCHNIWDVGVCFHTQRMNKPLVKLWLTVRVYRMQMWKEKRQLNLIILLRSPPVTSNYPMRRNFLPFISVVFYMHPNTTRRSSI